MDCAQKALITEHITLVRQIAVQLMKRLPRSVELDDLVAAGNLGLVEAARQYKATGGASFRTYAAIRIRGAILDSLRQNTWLPRKVFQLARAVLAKHRELSQTLLRRPTVYEIAESLGIESREIYTMHQRLFSSYYDDIDEHHDAVADESSPLDITIHDEKIIKLNDAILNLKPRYRELLHLLYDHDLPLEEIAKRWGVTPSRICQLHKKITNDLNTIMNEVLAA